MRPAGPTDRLPGSGADVPREQRRTDGAALRAAGADSAACRRRCSSSLTFRGRRAGGRWTRSEWALAIHDDLVGNALRDAAGSVFKHTGDGLIARFPSAPAAVAGAIAAQRRLAGPWWGDVEPLAVRVAIHAGEADRRADDWFGSALNRCARLLEIAHGHQVLVSGAVQALCVDGLPGGIGLGDLGRHRLRDLLNAEHVWQVEADGLRTTFPPLRSLDDHSGNLPVQLTGFLGRSCELAELTQALGSHRLITLVGAGGMGKTRLALQAAAEAVDAFGDGVWLVELAPLQTPESVDHAVAAALRLDPRGAGSPRHTVVEAMRGRRALLVLDNCEHLRVAAASLVRELLRDCPHLVVVATSREALRVPGEQRWPVGPLDTEGTAVDLFVERATAVRRGFVLAEGEHATVARICRELDGMPLAIELAASRMKSLTIHELAAKLDRRFRLLGGRAGDDDPRHATLQDVVAWSFDLLDPVEQRLVCRLSVFAGSFDLEAVHRVCAVGAGDVDLDEDELLTLGVLDSLVERSLVIAEEKHGTTRFRLLETIRQWGEARLGEDRHGLVGDHADYYAELIGRLRLADQRRFPLEIDNLRLAIHYALGRGDTGLAFLIIRRLWRHMSVSMVGLEAERWAELALALPGAGDDPESYWAHILLAAVGNIVADGHRTMREARAALAVEQRLALEPNPVARWWLCIGAIWVADYDEAGRAADEALAVCGPQQTSRRIEILFQSIHIAVYRGGEPDDALLLRWQEAAAQAGSPFERFSVDYAEGVIAARADPLRAADHFEGALAALRRGSFEHSIAGAALMYVGLLRAGDDPRRALASLKAGLAFYRTARVPFGLRRMVRDLLPAFADLGDHEAVATIDGAAAPPVLRPALVAEAITRSRAALGEPAFAAAARRGGAMSDEQLEGFVRDRLSAVSVR